MDFWINYPSFIPPITTREFARSSDITRGLSVYSRCGGIARAFASGAKSLNRHFLVAIRRDPGPEAESDLRRKRGLVCTISADASS